MTKLTPSTQLEPTRIFSAVPETSSMRACRIPSDLSAVGLHYFGMPLLSIGWNGLGHGRGLNRIRLGRPARLICIIHPTGWMMGCMNQTCWIHTTGWTAGWSCSYTRYSRLFNRLFNWLDNRLHHVNGVLWWLGLADGKRRGQNSATFIELLFISNTTTNY